MKDRDEIQELFSKKLGNMEAKVDPALWNNIASQIGASSTVAATSISFVSKLIIGSTITAAIVVSSYLLLNNKEDVDQPKKVVGSVIHGDPKTGEELNLDSFKTKEDEHVSEDNTSEKQTPLRRTTSISNEELGVKEGPTQLKEKLERSPIYTFPRPLNTIEESESENEITAPDNKQVYQHQVNTNSEEEDKNIEILLPNVFTPNGDNTNDQFKILSDKGGLPDSDVSVIIMDKKGNVVQEFTSLDFVWDGTDKRNQQASEGVYACMIVIMTTEKEAIKVFKQFELCRGTCSGN